MATFLKGIAAHGPHAELKPIEDMIKSLSKSVRFDVSSLSPQLLQGMVRGIFLVANWPRLWNPHDGDPGLFVYIDGWLGEWRSQYHGLPPPSGEAIDALRERVRLIHVELYPAVLRYAQYDLHAILKELLARDVPTIRGRAAEMPLTPWLSMSKSRSGSRIRLRRSTLVKQLSLPPPLGPFKLVAIRFESVGFVANNDVGMVAGGSYTVDLQCKFLAPYKHLIKDGSGRFSPREKLTLSKENREAAGIPHEAVTFAFAYPVASALQDSQDEGLSWRTEDSDSASDTADGSSTLLADCRMSFLALGGFVYFAADGHVVSVNALTNGPGLEFSNAVTLPYDCGLRAALYEADRVQPVTIEGLFARGVRKFAWLAPGEDICGVETPHGAFVYFYEEEHCRNDCYFSVVQAKDLQHTHYSSSEERTITLDPVPTRVSDMAPIASSSPPRSTRPPEDEPLAAKNGFDVSQLVRPPAAPTVSVIPADATEVEQNTGVSSSEANQPAPTPEVNVAIASAASTLFGMMIGGGLTLVGVVVMGSKLRRTQ